jgi:hypothetical protein
MKVKFTILSLLLALTATATWGQGVSKRLVLWQKSGEKVYFDLNDMPETTFENGMLVIKTNNASVQYHLENILRYTFEGTGNTGINLQPSERSISMSKEGDEVTMRNLRAGTVVTIYAANGTILETKHVTDNQPLTLSVAQRPAGVYIVKAGSETIKLLKQ